MPGIAEIIVSSLFWLLVPASFLLSALCLAKWYKGEKIVAWYPRAPVPWTLIDILASGLIAIFFVGGVPTMFAIVVGIDFSKGIDTLNVQEQLYLLMASSVGVLISCFSIMFFVRIRVRANFQDFGIAVDRLNDDLVYGVLGFATLIMPVLAIQFGLAQLFPNAGQHPFVELLADDPNPIFIVFVFLAAVGIAPFAEEFLFRVLFQGWIERILDDSYGSENPEVTLAEAHENPAVVDDSLHGDSTDQVDNLNPFSPPSEGASNSVRSAEIPFSEKPAWVRWTPILISSVAFSVAHYGHGTAPIALFFLALGLGYLYQRTHRIWASMVVHVLVNLLAVLQLQMLIDQAN